MSAGTILREKYPDKIPVKLEKYKHSDVPSIVKQKMLVSAGLKFCDFKHHLGKEINLASEQTIFVFVKNKKTLPPTAETMSTIYEQHKEEEDGILHMTYSGEDIITDLLFTTRISLDILHSMMTEVKGVEYLKFLPNTWTPYLSNIKLLLSMAESDKKVMEQTQDILKVRQETFSSLVAAYTKLEDREWIYKVPECINAEVRHHFSKIMFHHEESEELHIVLDRSNLLTESLEQIAAASPTSLHGSLSIYFKHEEAEGEGVLHEWFCVVCENLFQPDRKLFVQSHDDCRRFTPNSASSVYVDHLKYFRFAGRFIALALKNGIEIGVLLDPVFYLQLAGKLVSLDDIKHTDLREYTSCLQILEMSQAEFDEADLCLSFSEIEDDHQRKTMTSFWEDDNNIAVTFENRGSYIDLRIEYLYVTRIKHQVSHFIQGFEDIISVPHDVFFNNLNLEDIDGLLRGKEQDAICIDDWKSHTDYENFKETDTVIKWFWKILNSMDQGRRQNLLFFWTARKFLPVGGFKKLSEKLIISRMYKESDGHHPLPQSRTCIFQLKLRKYKGFDEMKKQLCYITESVNRHSFGLL